MMAWKTKYLPVDDDGIMHADVQLRPSADDTLWELQQLCSKRGLTFSLSVREGNIATGEAGWQVLVRERSGGLRELACDYGVETALVNAVARLRDS
jgi:hypothetical protein